MNKLSETETLAPVEHLQSEAFDETGFHTEPFNTPADRLAASRFSPARRQWMVERLLVSYAVFKEGYAMIADNHRPVDNGTQGKGTIAAIIGDSHTGKTWICKSYTSKYPPHYDDVGEIVPVIHLTATDKIKPEEFARALNRLTIARQPRTSRGGVQAFVDQALDQLMRARTELLIIDDAQYLFYNQTKDGAGAMYKIVKKIADFKTLTIVLVGEGTINNYAYSIPSFENREYNWLPLRGLGSGDDDMERFGGLLRGIDRRLPFENLSGLDTESLKEDFYRFSGGKIGRLMNLIRPAAFRALNDKSSRVRIEHLQHVVKTRVAPDDSYNYFGYLPDAA
jgi:hypothetical protein